MRLSDILKKTSSNPPAATPQVQNIPVQQQKISLAMSKNFIPELKTAAALPEFPLAEAEHIYSGLITEVKNMLHAVSKGQVYDSDFSSISKLVESLPAAMDALALISDKATPDTYLYGHMANVCIYAAITGAALGYTKNQLEQLALAALLDDIGMIKFLDVAQRPVKFSTNEHNIIKRHIFAARDMIGKFGGIPSSMRSTMSNIITQTHERQNGSGYPEGLIGSSIATQSKIIAVCDVYEALTHPRAYRQRIIPHEAVKTIIGLSEDSLDPDIVKTFVNSISLYPPGTYVRLNSDEIAKVIRTNPQMPTRPVVKIVLTPDGRKETEQKTVNLADNPMLFIKEPLDETKLNIQDKKLLLELKAMRWWVKGI